MGEADIRILLVAAGGGGAALLQRPLEESGHCRVERVDTLGAARESAVRSPPGLVVADRRLPDGEAIRLLDWSSPPLPLVVVCEPGRREPCDGLLEAGALDCVTTGDLAPECATALVARALRLRELQEARVRAEAELRRRLAYERVLADVSALALVTEDLEELQSSCLEALGQALDVSRIYIFEHRHDTDTMDNTFEWVAPDVSPQKDALQGVPAAEIPWWMERLRKNQVINVSDIEEIPGAAEREILRSQNICSVLAVPLFVGRRYHGFIGFDECRETRSWLPEDVEVLRTVARILAGALERSRSEASLRESEARFRRLSAEFNALLDAIPDNLTLQSPDLRILWANRGAADGAKLAVGELLGHSCFQVWHGRTSPCEACPVQRSFQTGEPAHQCVATPDGRAWELRAVPIHDEGGGVGAVIEVGRDITESRNAELEREALIRELGAKNVELEQFTYTVSHDLKGPLTTIRGFAGLARRELERDRQERVATHLGHIATAADKMKQLLDELLELSRIGRLTHAPAPVPLVEVAREAAADFAVQLAERGVSLEIDEGLPVVMGDRLRLRQVLENLIGNAVKFLGGQEAPRIEIGARSTEDGFVCFVRDNGIGIDPADHGRIFALFEKLSAESEGTGVGLAIVKRIVEVHGGKIWVESTQGRGSTFCFTLGRRKPDRSA